MRVSSAIRCAVFEIVFQLLDRHFIPLDGPTNLLLGIIGENRPIKCRSFADSAGEDQRLAIGVDDQ
jgi:hypothetical protein